jgi:hypothetical protein
MRMLAYIVLAGATILVEAVPATAQRHDSRLFPVCMERLRLGRSCRVQGPS